MNRIINSFSRNSYPLIFALIVNACIHLPFMNRPPESMHVWRQCNTLAVARNFYEESMNIFQPRVDNRFETKGVTGMNFPLYEYSVACMYKVFGEHFWVHRILSLLIFSAGAIGLFYLTRSINGPVAMANLSAIAFLFFPDLFYFSINALPDIMALSFMIWGCYHFVTWYNTFQDNGSVTKKLWMAAVLLMLCGLVKLYFLLIGCFIAGLLLPSYKQLLKPKYVLSLALFALTSVAVPVLWYKYSIELIKKSGLADFGLEVRSETDPGKALAILSQNIFSDIPELVLNYINFVFVLAAVFFLFRLKVYRYRYFNAFLFFFIGVVLYHIAELRQMKHHSYYMMPYYPMLAIVAGFGAWTLLIRYPKTTLALMLISPVVCSLRIIPTRWMNDNKLMPVELYAEDSRTRLSNAVSNSDRCIVTGDISNCIYFYFLHKKGFCYANDSMLLDKWHTGEPVIANNITRGAKFIYLYNPGPLFRDRLAPFLDELVIKEGNFYVYCLKDSTISPL